VLHCAASLSFESGGREGEPWRSNLDGTRHVLDLCRRVGIREYHHVSTAYVCGLREGRVLESELEVGQSFANDYEQSKLEAEKLVRSAGFLDPPTIYRPSIIVGDSRTGYTSTFHGFYTPLKIMHAIVYQIDTSEVSSASYLAALGLSGREKKNFVPVDWVARVISQIVDRPKHHGRTYHLTPDQRVDTSLVAEVVEAALRKYVDEKGWVDGRSGGETPLELLFRSQMDVYRSYWRGDPEFDRANTVAAVPDLPCPTVDRAMLMRTAWFALRANFGWPRPQTPEPGPGVPAYLRPWLEAAEQPPLNGRSRISIGLQVNGPGGGQWELLLHDDSVAAAEQGLPSRPAATIYMNSKTFERLAAKECSGWEAVEAGSVLVEGNGIRPEVLRNALEALGRLRRPQ
jgi:nucleoside-diphosphate-sugar epimerase